MTDSVGSNSGWRRFLAEPLLHFLILGGLLFWLDSRLVERRDDPRVIHLDAAVEAEIRQLFSAERGRDPDPAEMRALQERWVNNEILYREGLAQRLDKGDKAIQDRVIFKMLSVVETGLKAPPATDDTLRAYFDANRIKYDEPERLDFDEATLVGKADEVAVRDFAAALNDNRDVGGEANLRVFKARPLPTIDQGYGQDFSAHLRAAEQGRWLALETRDGWRAFRLASVTPAKPAVFEEVRAAVRQHWLDATMAELRTRAVEALGRKYRIIGWERTP